MDIFEFEMPEHALPQKVTYVKGIITSATSKKPLAANLIFIDMETGKIVNEKIADAVTGEYLLTLPLGKEYIVHATAKDHLFYSQHFSLKEKNDARPFIQNIEMAKIETDKKIILENVFFDKDSFRLKEESFIELDKVADFLLKNSKLRIEISGHTDSSGKPEYNLKLSELRAKAVYDYLLSKNVQPSQLIYIGYGDKYPLADNETEAGRIKNRRTELRITGVD
jgi:outer membrane protein OmpA-like peptidoglycan-associated protein